MDTVADYASADSDSGSDRAPSPSPSAAPQASASVRAPVRPPPPFGPTLPATADGRQVLLHVFIPAPAGTLAPFVRRSLGRARLQLVGKSVKASFCPHESLHVSISRACAVDERRVPDVVAELRKALAGTRGGTVAIEEFIIALPSQNNARLFTAAPVSKESAREVVLPLIRAVDGAFSRMGLPIFYQNPLPHMSFASTASTAVRDSFPDAIADRDGVECIGFPVSHVVCEAGHRQYSFSLTVGDE